MIVDCAFRSVVFDELVHSDSRRCLHADSRVSRPGAALSVPAPVRRDGWPRTDERGMAHSQ